MKILRAQTANHETIKKKYGYLAMLVYAKHIIDIPKIQASGVLEHSTVSTCKYYPFTTTMYKRYTDAYRWKRTVYVLERI